jgi:hypothetical protein
MEQQPRTEPFPIEFSKYRRGDKIHASVVERAYGIARDDRRYRLRAQLQMKAAAEHAFRLRGEGEVTIVCRGDDLVILTHAEASRENTRRFWQHFTGAGRARVRHADVDPAQIPEGERLPHALQQTRMGRMLAAAVRASRTMRLPDTKRITPKPDTGGNDNGE